VAPLITTAMHWHRYLHFPRFEVVPLALLLCAQFAGAESFRVATYNVEGYLSDATQTRSAKTAEAKAKVRESIRALNPEVLALQEMGRTNALLELRDSLKADGLDLPYWEHVAGFDTNIHVAVLSRYPFTARRPHTNDSFLLSGRRFRVSRGFAEVDVQVNANYSFTLITAHLKSKRAVAQADEAELRLEEAKLLRDTIDARLAAESNANLVVLGDFNDTKDSASTKAVIGRGKLKLVDTRPAERNGDDPAGPNTAREPRNVTWTHYYGKEY
jgi:endonuclease/exonuclease/phosphatase family metal-dependent hydrolase